MDPESKSDAVVASCELIEGKVANAVKLQTIQVPK